MESHNDKNHGEHQRAQVSETATLAVLLGLFVFIGIIALFTIVIGGTHRGDEVVSGTRAYGPRDFADKIDWDKALHQEIRAVEPGKEAKAFPVPPPPISEDYYPCTACHEPGASDVNPTPRELTEEHEGFKVEHGPKDRWCYDCHNKGDRDKLRLVNGTLIGFDESYQLCGQCHGTIYRDWQQGIHGRRSGYWNGPKAYLLCVHCHNPHKPHFPKLEPLPPPVRPDYLRAQGD